MQSGTRDVSSASFHLSVKMDFKDGIAPSRECRFPLSHAANWKLAMLIKNARLKSSARQIDPHILSDSTRFTSLDKNSFYLVASLYFKGNYSVINLDIVFLYIFSFISQQSVIYTIAYIAFYIFSWIFL